MQCEDALRAFLDAKYEGREPPPEAVEALQREECRALLEKSQKLDALLALDEPHEPAPGFDTRFFARLEDEKKKGQRRWIPAMFAALTAGAAALALAMLTSAPRENAANEVELAVVEELELFEELAVIEQLEDVEAYELLAAVDADTLERLIQEEGQ